MQKKSLETILYSTAGVAVMGGILVAVNLLASLAPQRIDLTQEKAYTLSAGTRTILDRLDTPVKIRFYCTRGGSPSAVSVQLKGYARTVEDLLSEYKQHAHGKLIIEKYDPEPDTDAEDSARLDGVEPQPMPDGDRFYLGLAVSMLDVKETIPFLSPERERQLEYDISRALTRVVTPQKPVIGVMSPLPVFGMPMNPMMAQMGRSQGQEPWTIIHELQADFELKRVDMDTEKIDDDIRVLLVIHPRDISDQAQYAIDQFVLRGGKLVAFLDGQSLVDSRGGQNQMFGNMPGGGSSLDKLIKAWGLQFESAKVVADRELKMVLGEQGNLSQQRPVWLALTPDQIHSNDITTAELDNIWMFSAGVFTGTAADGLKQSVLLKTSRDSQLVDGMLANFSPDNILKEFNPSGVEYALAVRLSGKFKTAFPDGKPNNQDAATNTPAADNKSDGSLKESAQENTVILAGDADMIYDAFTLQRTAILPGLFAMRQLNGNLNFAQNAVEQLAGGDHLIGVRSRAALNRPFTRVRQMQAEAEASFLKKIKELEAGRDAAVARLNELQQQKTGNQRFILSPEQQTEIENLRKKEAEINRELRQVNKDLRRNVDALTRRVQMYNIAAVPIAVCVVGIGLAIYKRKRTSAK